MLLMTQERDALTILHCYCCSALQAKVACELFGRSTAGQLQLIGTACAVGLLRAAPSGTIDTQGPSTFARLPVYDCLLHTQGV
jgi:hypothetical protein